MWIIFDRKSYFQNMEWNGQWLRMRFWLLQSKWTDPLKALCNWYDFNGNVFAPSGRYKNKESVVICFVCRYNQQRDMELQQDGNGLSIPSFVFPYRVAIHSYIRWFLRIEFRRYRFLFSIPFPRPFYVSIFLLLR